MQGNSILIKLKKAVDYTGGNCCVFRKKFTGKKMTVISFSNSNLVFVAFAEKNMLKVRALRRHSKENGGYSTFGDYVTSVGEDTDLPGVMRKALVFFSKCNRGGSLSVEFANFYDMAERVAADMGYQIPVSVQFARS